MLKRLAIAALVMLVTTAATAQQQTGEIFGRVTDTSGAVLPGATVTIAGPALIQPRVTITSEVGTYRAPELPIGTYSVTVDLAGFRTVVHQDIRVTIGFRAQVNSELGLSTVQESVTVSGQSPLVDTIETGTKTAFDRDALQNIPSARDPWVMLERTPGIAMDRANVGGSQSGQQSGFVSRGAGGGNTKWSVDGVDITDMSATGATPMYFDFDMLEQMQVTTGGADVTQQTGGVGINLVTRSGTDQFRGSGRFYVTDESLQADNVTDEVRAGGVGAGAPIQNIQDRGVEVGGPIVRGRAWYWGSYGSQDIKTGVVGFYKSTPACRPGGQPLDPTQASTELLRSCLETDLTTLNNYNWKVTLVPFRNSRFTFQNTWAEKVRNARDASDLRPIETTFRQKAASSDFGSFGWVTGPGPFWKAGDQHVISDRWLVEAMWAHVGNNFVLDFHDDALRDVQAALETSNGRWSRSYQASVFLRPTNSVDVLSSYFLPSMLGGDHALKAGYRWRTAHSTNLNHRGGYIDARYLNGVPNSADIWRDGNSVTHLDTHGLYLQDTFTRQRLTVNLGFRFDHQRDAAIATTVPENPLFPDLMPAIAFPGADLGVKWADFSPRVGMTYDLGGNGRTIVSAAYAAYFGQLAPGQLSGVVASTGAVFVRYPWNDANGNGFVERSEVNLSGAPLSRSNAYNPTDPGNFRTTTGLDPNIKSDRTREVIVGFDRQLNNTVAVGASYIWRKFDRFQWGDRIVTDNNRADGALVRDWTSADYRAVTATPTGCIDGARCDTYTYYEPSSPLPAPLIYTNVPDFWRDYNGLEVTFTKRMSNRWSLNASYAYNDAVDVRSTPAAYEDPTCVDAFTALTNVASCPGEQAFAPQAAGSGIDNVFINAKWMLKATGTFQLPWSVNLAAAWNARQGYPFPQAIRTPNRANSAGTADVLLDPLGDSRHPMFQQLDLRVDKRFQFGPATLRPSFDLFNITNANTVLARRRLQAASNANQISGIIAPRVARLGISVLW